MHVISPGYTLTAIPPKTSSVAHTTVANTASSSTTGSTSSGSAGSDIGSTFLSLLSQELQNQDPTAPVDSTAMVGQMISLNQLDQLISINQSLSSLSSSTPTSASGATGSARANAAQQSANSVLAGSSSPSTAVPASYQLPFDPNTLMPLGFGTGVMQSSAMNPSLNAATMGMTGTNTNFNTKNSGGK